MSDRVELKLGTNPIRGVFLSGVLLRGLAASVPIEAPHEFPSGEPDRYVRAVWDAPKELDKDDQIRVVQLNQKRKVALEAIDARLPEVSAMAENEGLVAISAHAQNAIRKLAGLIVSAHITQTGLQVGVSTEGDGGAIITVRNAIAGKRVTIVLDQGGTPIKLLSVGKGVTPSVELVTCGLDDLTEKVAPIFNEETAV